MEERLLLSLPAEARMTQARSETTTNARIFATAWSRGRVLAVGNIPADWGKNSDLAS